MAYKHKIRVSHILDDLDRGFIKTRAEYESALKGLEKESFIEHFLAEYDERELESNPAEENLDQEIELLQDEESKPEDSSQLSDNDDY